MGVIEPARTWRMAGMFDDPDGDADRLGAALLRLRPAIARIAGDVPLRLGAADRHPSLAPLFAETSEPREGVDGAVEITVPAGRAGELRGLAAALADVLAPLAAAGSLQLMAGPMFSMVPVSDGEVFLSLAFRRDAALTSPQFRHWWHDVHAPLAIALIGHVFLAYDQVHVDHQASRALTAAAGARPHEHDAYDNLTWADRETFLASIADAAVMARIDADEAGHIAFGSRRSALMRRLR